MEGTRDIYVGEVCTGCWWISLSKRDHLELSVDGNIVLEWNLKIWDGDLDRIDLAQDRDRWRALVNAVMNLRVP